jgi:hypothetical protein
MRRTTSRRAERFAEEFDGSLATGFGDDIAAGTELFTKLAEELSSVAVATIYDRNRQ